MTKPRHCGTLQPHWVSQFIRDQAWRKRLSRTYAGVPRPITKWSRLRTCGPIEERVCEHRVAASVQDIRDRKVGGGLDLPARKEGGFVVQLISSKRSPMKVVIGALELDPPKVAGSA